MDIRRRTTYISRSSDGRPSHNYSSYFQSAQKKYLNIDPNSGIHLVGPMFELTACSELQGHEEDFESMYPDSSLTFEPTICSFGLKYNDHNYALPLGLTPPSMAPHLMDLQLPKYRYADTKSLNSCSKDVSTIKSCGRVKTEVNQGSRNANDKGSEKLSGLSSKRSCIDEMDNTTTENKKQFAESWYSKSAMGPDDNMMISDNNLNEQCLSSRFGSQLSSYEQMELRSEPELKVIEVPEELAVSPSQLSDLDSDISDMEYPTKIVLPNPTGPYSQTPGFENQWTNGGVWPDIKCLCGHSQPKSRLIHCPKCSTCQHVPCMESYYNVSMPQLSEGYICSSCGADNPHYETSDNQVKEASSVQENHPQSSEADAKSPSEVKNLTVKFSATNEGNVGAQYVEVTADRAKRLGLIANTPKVESGSPSGYTGSWSFEKSHGGSKETDNLGRSGWAPVNWDKLTEMSRSAKRHYGDTDVNLRMPSPPRTSKRKQDLTSTSYNDADVAVSESPIGRNPVLLSNTSDDLSSSGVTPSSTPSSTPLKMGSSLPTPATPASTPGGTLTPGSGYSSSSGTEASPRRPRNLDRNHKVRRVLFPDATGKQRFDARKNPFGAAWTKDYREAEENVYTTAILEYVNSRIVANLERNHRIPPPCLTRSPLCRVVMFDHDNKGLEASIKLAPNEVVTEVRGHFLLMEEYEHYVDPVSDYNRYVMFYHGFGDRALVIDTSRYGNNARFVRRSCISNCRLEHYVVQNKLQIVIRTSAEVMPGTELTIPFDLDYQACRYPLDCACARSRCPVVKWRRKLLRNKVVPNLDYSKYIESQLRVLSKPLSQESPNGRSFDQTSLTGSPLVKTYGNSNVISVQQPRLSPTVNYNMLTSQSVSPHSYQKGTAESHKIESKYPQFSRSADTDDDGDDDNKSRESNTLDVISDIQIPCSHTSNSDVNQNDDGGANSSEGNCGVTDENQVPDTSHAAESQVPEKPASRTSTRHKEQSHRKIQDSSDDKLVFEPIITTRRQAAAMKNVLR